MGSRRKYLEFIGLALIAVGVMFTPGVLFGSAGSSTGVSVATDVLFVAGLVVVAVAAVRRSRERRRSR